MSFNQPADDEVKRNMAERNINLTEALMTWHQAIRDAGRQCYGVYLSRRTQQDRY